jgi:hypothetical protein
VVLYWDEIIFEFVGWVVVFFCAVDLLLLYHIFCVGFVVFCVLLYFNNPSEKESVTLFHSATCIID